MYPQFDTLEVVDMQAPEPGLNDILVRVHACGICGSELETFASKSPRRTPPLVMGHEFCGEIVAVGKGVSSWKVGERVVSHAVVHCGKCDCCNRGDEHLCRSRQVFGMHRQGAFADYVCVPERVAIGWPDNLQARMACLAEPLANGVHVAGLLERWRPRRCLVIGAGPIGLLCQQAMQVILDAEVMVCDLDDGRLVASARCGSCKTVNPKRSDLAAAVMDWTHGQGADCVVDAVGSELTKRQSLELSRPGAGVVWLGLHQDEMKVDSYQITLTERSVMGSYSARIDDLITALKLMSDGRIESDSWVGTSLLQDGVTAFRNLLTHPGEAIKTVLLTEPGIK